MCRMAKFRSSKTDQYNEGALRYVLEGTGQLVCAGETYAVAPNTLVRVRDGMADVPMEWTPDDGSEELVLLTPEYRGPPLLPIAGSFLIVFAALIAASFGG